MRRWIFALLVLLNLGLLIWGVFYIEVERAETPELPPEIAPEKMRLLKKEAVRSKTRAARIVDADLKPVVSTVSTPSGAAGSLDCYAIGPLTEVSQVQRIEQGLGGRSFHRREEAAHVVTGYRVYLPSFATREEAERKRRELTKLGFKDHALLQEEGFQNALSLGLFSVEENAQARIQSLAEKGILAQMQKLDQTRVLYWIEFARAETAVDERTELKGLVDGIPGANVHELTCAPPQNKP